MIEFARPALPTDNYTLIPNHLWTDPRMNGNAVRLVGFILSRPAGWRMNRDRIKEAVELGDAAFDTAVTKAEEAGWITRAQTRDEGGRMANTRYTVAFPPEVTVTGKPGDGTVTGKPGTGKPGEHVPGNPERAYPETRTLNKTESKTETKMEDVGSATVAVLDGPEEDGREDVDRLLDALDAEIRFNGNRVPSRTKKNRDAMRLLLDRDGWSEEQVAYVIRWSQSHEFWRPNILSASKLRAKFDTLVAQVKEDGRKSSAPAASRQDGWADAAARLQGMGVQ